MGRQLKRIEAVEFALANAQDTGSIPVCSTSFNPAGGTSRRGKGEEEMIKITSSFTSSFFSKDVPLRFVSSKKEREEYVKKCEKEGKEAATFLSRANSNCGVYVYNPSFAIKEIAGIAPWFYEFCGYEFNEVKKRALAEVLGRWRLEGILTPRQWGRLKVHWVTRISDELFVSVCPKGKAPYLHENITTRVREFICPHIQVWAKPCFAGEGCKAVKALKREGKCVCDNCDNT